MAAGKGRMRWVADGLAGLDAAGRLRRLRVLDAPPAPRARVDGHDVVVLCGNDYLGLATHPDVVQAVADAGQQAAGSTASRLVCGTTEEHVALEQDLARLKGTEAAALFATGYMANVGTIPSLVGKGDLVVSDRLNHASVVDGCRLSGATVRVFAHADARDAARILREERAAHRRALVVTDGVFSMDGDEAPLGALCDAAIDHDAMMMVDDAHGTGVLGPGGAGTAHAQGVADRVDVHMGTLSKALGGAGGFVAGSEDLVAWLWNRARSFVYSTAPPPAQVAAARAALRVAGDDGLRERLGDSGRRLRGGLEAMGHNVAAGRTPIVPVHFGTEARVMAAADALLARGVYAAGIRPPTVPEGSCRIRATVSAAHTPKDIDEAIAAFAVPEVACASS